MCRNMCRKVREGNLNPDLVIVVLTVLSQRPCSHLLTMELSITFSIMLFNWYEKGELVGTNITTQTIASWVHSKEKGPSRISFKIF